MRGGNGHELDDHVFVEMHDEPSDEGSQIVTNQDAPLVAQCRHQIAYFPGHGFDIVILTRLGLIRVAEALQIEGDDSVDWIVRNKRGQLSFQCESTIVRGLPIIFGKFANLISPRKPAVGKTV